jgi:pyridoxamine 5'-phosphate oxidase
MNPNPMDLLMSWLEEERTAGALHAQHAILSTSGVDGYPHGRVVAVREIQSEGLIFFTQKGTRKVEEMIVCPNVTLTFWYERFARQVIIEGIAEFLSESENERYWLAYPKWAQIRFYSYAQTSGKPIVDKQILEDKKREIEISYKEEQILPMSEYYCGVSVRPKRVVFYAYRLDELSDACEYQQIGGSWVKSPLSP